MKSQQQPPEAMVAAMVAVTDARERMNEARKRLNSATADRSSLARVVADLVCEGADPAFVAYMAAQYSNSKRSEAESLQELSAAHAAFNAARSALSA